MKVLDASGLINLRGSEFKGEYLTVGEIKGEMKDIQARVKFESAVAEGRIRLEEPSAKSISHISDIAEKNGVLPLLSTPDLKVIALAYERGLPIVTDDYDIQNMCWIIGIGFETVSLPGIKGPYTWKKKCSACGRETQEDISECESCGSKHFNVIRKQTKKIRTED